MTKTILITGGTGKLGAQFVKHFMNKNFNVIFTSLKQSEIDALLKNEILNNKKTLGIEIDLEKKDLASNILNFLTKIFLPNPMSCSTISYSTRSWFSAALMLWSKVEPSKTDVMHSTSFS